MLYLYTSTVLDGSVILFVHYRNHFAVVQFQNQAQIRNPHDPAEVFKLWGAAGATHFFLSIFFTAAEGGAN